MQNQGKSVCKSVSVAGLIFTKLGVAFLGFELGLITVLDSIGRDRQILFFKKALSCFLDTFPGGSVGGWLETLKIEQSSALAGLKLD